MTRRIRSLYRLKKEFGSELLERAGWISEAQLRAFEYFEEKSTEWQFDSGPFQDTVHRWRTSRPDLHVPEELLVGDYEVKVAP